MRSESTIKRIYGMNLEINVSRIALAGDPTKLPAGTTFEFMIERRAGRPFSEKRYFSSATLPTTSHLDFLKPSSGGYWSAAKEHVRALAASTLGHLSRIRA